MSLTPKQEAFALAYLETGSAIESYRKAGYSSGMSDKTAMEAASRLLKNSKVVARLDALRKAAADASLMTVASHLERLEKLSRAAEADGKFSAAVSAEVARGKVSGFYVEKVEHSGEIKTPELKLVLHGTKPSSTTN